MPKAVFRPLPGEKRNKILKAARRPFAERVFAATDTGEIARQSGVTKGFLHNAAGNLPQAGPSFHWDFPAPCRRKKISSQLNPKGEMEWPSKKPMRAIWPRRR
jgi:hypothetical protein